MKVAGGVVNNLALVNEALQVVDDEDCKKFARDGWAHLMAARPINPEQAPARVTQLLNHHDIDGVEADPTYIAMVNQVPRSYSRLIAEAIDEHMAENEAE